MSEIELLTKQEINWIALRATMDKALELRTEIDYPVEFSEDAEYLLNLARYHGIEIKNPLNLLRNYPSNLLIYLHYSFLVACDKRESYILCIDTNLEIIPRNVNLDCLLIVSGTLDQWYNSIIMCLRKESDITFLIDKFLLIFEKRGLGYLFENYRKMPLKDGRFLLE